jgi:hypothetical protein
MANEIAKRDENLIPVALGVTDDANKEVRMLRADPTSKRLKVSATIPGFTGTTSVSGNYVILASDATILVDASSSSITLTLPDATSVIQRPFIIKKTDATTNEVKISPSGGQTIDGAPLYVLDTPNEAVTLESNGTTWFTI